jgi:hypothetical protein
VTRRRSYHLDVPAKKSEKARSTLAVARWGGLDILVNNAGLFLGKDIKAGLSNLVWPKRRTAPDWGGGLTGVLGRTRA